VSYYTASSYLRSFYICSDILRSRFLKHEFLSFCQSCLFYSEKILMGCFQVCHVFIVKYFCCVILRDKMSVVQHKKILRLFFKQNFCFDIKMIVWLAWCEKANNEWFFKATIFEKRNILTPNHSFQQRRKEMNLFIDDWFVFHFI